LPSKINVSSDQAPADNLQAFGHDVVGRLMVRAKALVRPAVRMAAAGGEIHAAAADQIQHRRFLGKLHRMMHRQRVHRDAEAQPFGSLRRRPEHHIGRGQQRESGLAVNLGDPIGVKSQAISQLRLLQEFFQPRRWRRALWALNFGEQAADHLLPIPFDRVKFW
jgi:hypothetical protein